MARTSLTTNNVNKLEHHLIHGQDQKAYEVASDIVAQELSNYPVGTDYANTYLFIAVAFTRYNCSNSGPLEAMKLSAEDSQHYALLRGAYDTFMHNHPNRIHPFGLYLGEIASSVKRWIKRSLSTLTRQ